MKGIMLLISRQSEALSKRCPHVAVSFRTAFAEEMHKSVSFNLQQNIVAWVLEKYDMLLKKNLDLLQQVYNCCTFTVLKIIV